MAKQASEVRYNNVNINLSFVQIFKSYDATVITIFDQYHSLESARLLYSTSLQAFT